MNVRIGNLIREMLGINKRFNEMHRRIKVLEEMVYRNQNMFSPPAESGGGSQGGRLVVPFLSGGLGNQLFQISAAYALARKIKSKLALNYDLFAGLGQGSNPRTFKETLYKNIPETDVVPEYIYKYSGHRYKRIPFLTANVIQVEGFFQSSKFFEDYGEEIRHLYAFSSEDMAQAKEFLAKDSRPTVGIHIRLGDYLNHPRLQAFSKDYYQNAVARFPKDHRFIICSDSPEMAFEILERFQPEVFRGRSEETDLFLLSQCENLVMSNSTFSFWAYYFGRNKKTTIAPQHWFHPKLTSENCEDIYEKEWVRI